MLDRRTLTILVVLLAAGALLWTAVATVPALAESSLAVVVLVPLFAVYALHRLGVPGLLEHDGLCGWGWCAPTPAGGLLGAAALVLAAWVLAWGLAALTRRVRR